MDKFYKYWAIITIVLIAVGITGAVFIDPLSWVIAVFGAIMGFVPIYDWLVNKYYEWERGS
jgi:hypothetical protein